MGMDDTTVKLRGAPVLDEPALSAHSKMIADKLAVSELMSMAIVALPPVVRVRLLAHGARDCGRCGSGPSARLPWRVPLTRCRLVYQAC